jgi:ABC-type Fe3+-hydroxamate transport system substrate-binding protein
VASIPPLLQLISTHPINQRGEIRMWLRSGKWFAFALVFFLGTAGAWAGELSQEWEIVVPAGEVGIKFVAPATRISTLEGKTIVLRWNGKNNGDVVLDHLAGLLQARYPTAKIVKSYTDLSLATVSGNQENVQRIADAIIAIKPDLVIASQAD